MFEGWCSVLRVSHDRDERRYHRDKRGNRETKKVTKSRKRYQVAFHKAGNWRLFTKQVQGRV